METEKQLTGREAAENLVAQCYEDDPTLEESARIAQEIVDGVAIFTKEWENSLSLFRDKADLERSVEGIIRKYKKDSSDIAETDIFFMENIASAAKHLELSDIHYVEEGETRHSLSPIRIYAAGEPENGVTGLIYEITQKSLGLQVAFDPVLKFRINIVGGLLEKGKAQAHLRKYTAEVIKAAIGENEYQKLREIAGIAA